MARQTKTFVRMVGGLTICLTLGSCGAPTFNVFGAYFPAWMLCAMTGIASAIAARLIFVAKALNNALPFQLVVCSAIGLIMGVLFWLVLFGL